MRTVKEQISADLFRTSWGWMGVAWTGRGVRGVILPRKERHEVAETLARVLGPGWEERPWREFRVAVRAFLAGRDVTFDFPLDLPGGGGFAGRVRDEARRIPRGKTATYAELARRAGNPRAARAVGQVMARNPVPLLLPCHRVVGADRGLGGYSGGVALKRALLEREASRGGGRCAR